MHSSKPNQISKPSQRLNALAIVSLAIFQTLQTVPAATIWNGPDIAFTQAAPYPNPGDRDQLTPNVALTRTTPAGLGTGGMFNAVTETAFTKLVSPADTAWAVGALSNYASLTYSDWTTTGGGNPVINLPGQQLVVHLISEDIYLSLMFTNLPAGPGFSYIRSTPLNVAPTVAITSPANGQYFTAPANATIVANANDPDGSVTNVAFFDGVTLLGGTNNSPYTITVGIALGSHALTAVATDNLGLSTTSSVVNVTVGVAAFPPSVTLTNPANNAVLSSSANVAIGASVSNSVGTVTNVQFFDGVTSLGNDTNSPYSVALRLAVGLHNLTAVASDNLGVTTTSAVVSVTSSNYLPAIATGNIAILLQPIATGMAAPDYAISPPGDTNRLFVVEQNGLLRIIQNGVLLPGSALDISGLISTSLLPTNPNDERGFLGLAFHPGFNNPASPGFKTLYTFNSQLLGSGRGRDSRVAVVGWADSKSSFRSTRIAFVGR